MIKSKPCLAESCNNPRFRGGYCKNHQRLREDKKPASLKKVSSKGKEKKELKKALYPTDMAFYFGIWNKRPHVCYNCDKDLGARPLTLYFDHILEKGNPKYAHLRHNEDNICLLCWDCHGTKSNGVLSKKLKQLRQDTILKLC